MISACLLNPKQTAEERKRKKEMNRHPQESFYLMDLLLQITKKTLKIIPLNPKLRTSIMEGKLVDFFRQNKKRKTSGVECFHQFEYSYIHIINGLILSIIKFESLF